mgnify:CR=1 FL=1
MNGTVIVKNGTIVTSSLQYAADILIKDGRINAILSPGSEAKADRIIDASNRFIIPGVIDEHTHMMDPGLTEREEFTSGTAAAAYGGVTTVIDHHRTVPPVYSLKELENKISYLNERSMVDFGLKGGISPDNLDELEPMWKRGITGFKTFTCNLHGVRAMYPGMLYKAFCEVNRFGGTVLIHCEDDSICSVNEERLKAEGRTDFASQMEWRSALAEEIAVKTVIAITRETKARVVIAHVSQASLLEEIHKEAEAGTSIYAESCPHYFYLTSDDVEAIGPWVKFTPPPKGKNNQDKMWKLFNLGYVTVIGSDHCPYPAAEKTPGEQNIWDAPNGIPGVETSLRIMLNAVNEGKTTLNHIVRTMCENPAKLEGLYPRKGTLEIGADADLLLLDMEHLEVIKNENIVSKCKWSPYNGRTLKGAPETVLVRGEVVIDHYKIVGKPGFGRFVPRGSK